MKSVPSWNFSARKHPILYFKPDELKKNLLASRLLLRQYTILHVGPYNVCQLFYNESFCQVSHLVHTEHSVTWELGLQHLMIENPFYCYRTD